MNIKFKNKIFVILIVFTSSSLLFVNCNKDKDNIPYVKVNIIINVISTQYNKLNTVGNWEYLTGGYKGIVVYRKSVDEFVAFDRCCTYKPELDCERIAIDKSGVVAKDSCCGSEFLLLDGSIMKGPAKRNLKSYNTSFDGVYLQIYN